MEAENHKRVICYSDQKTFWLNVFLFVIQGMGKQAYAHTRNHWWMAEGAGHMAVLRAHF